MNGVGGTTTGTPDPITGSFANIAIIKAHAGEGNVLVGENADRTWNFTTVSSTYGDGTNTFLTFSGFGQVTGGTGADTFSFAAGAIFNGSIDGGTGGDTLDLSAYTTAVTVTLTSSGLAGVGGTTAGTPDPITGSFANIAMIKAHAGEGNVLVGENATRTWDLTNSASTYSGTRLYLIFSGFGQVTGGTGADTFSFAAGAIFNGSIDGGTGGDTLDLSAYTTALTVTLTSGTVNGVGGTTSGTVDPITGTFANIAIIKANAGVSNVLVGENADRTWNFTTVSSTYGDGTNTFLTFSGFGQLTGGTGADTFVFADGAIFDGSIDGGTGGDTLDLSAYSTAVTVTLTSGAAAGVGGMTAGTPDPITGSFANIATIKAHAGQGNSLVGENAARTWDLNTTQTYGDGTTTFLTFSGFGSLTGGGGANTFNIIVNTTANLNGGPGNNNVFDFQGNGVALAGQINGGSGTGNTVQYSGYTAAHPVTMNLGTGLLTGTTGFSNLESLIGGNAATTTLIGSSASNVWTIDRNNQGFVTYSTKQVDFQTVGNLTGGVGNDVFALGDSCALSGIIDGGIGTNSLTLAAYNHSATVNITGANAGDVNENGGSDFRSLLRVGSALVTFVRVGTLTGTNYADTVAFNPAASLSGTLSCTGGGGTLNYSAYTTSVRVNLTTGAATGVYRGLAGGISGFENVTGGSANDILIGDGNANVLDGGPGGNDILVGLGGNDTLTVHGAGRNILIGGDGADTLDSSAATGENLLIGGRVAFAGNETNLAALESLMAEWSRTGVSFVNRCKHLTGELSGGLNGSYKLITSGVNQTVFGETDIYDTLKGNDTSGTGNTWFVAYWPSDTNHDTVSGQKAGDRLDKYGTVLI